MKFTIPRLALNAQKADYVPAGQNRCSKPRPVGRQSRCKIVTIKYQPAGTDLSGVTTCGVGTRVYFGGVEDALEFQVKLARRRAKLTPKECPYHALYEDIIDDTTARPEFELWNRILWYAFNALDAANNPNQYAFSYRMRPYRQQYKYAQTLTFQAVSSIGEPIVTF